MKEDYDILTMPEVLAPEKMSFEDLVKRYLDCEKMVRIFAQRLAILEHYSMISESFMHSLLNAAEKADNANQKLHEKESVAVLFDNDMFMQIMQMAVEQDFCKPVGWQFKWNKKCEAAYFASVASQKFNLTNRKDHDGDIAISWKPFEHLFGEDNLRLTFNDYRSCKTSIKRKNDIDKLFK